MLGKLKIVEDDLFINKDNINYPVNRASSFSILHCKKHVSNVLYILQNNQAVILKCL